MIKSSLDFNLKLYLHERADQVDRELITYLSSKNLSSRNASRIQAAMQHSLMAGGKRLRPILCIAAAESLGVDDAKEVLPAACALEMIHTYSLIHDDLPAMDDDALRRGKPTCHIAFDEATAIMAGDALLTLAFQILSMAVSRKIPAQPWLAVIQVISKAAGYTGMIEGQMRDMAFEDLDLAASDLESMHRLKTGALMRASVQSGAVLCNANPKQIEQLTAYADHIGLAFQITDDILNVEGNPEKMGKAVGTDILRKKGTYPALLGVERSRELAKKRVIRALHALDEFDKRANPLRSIATYILDRNR